MVTCKLNENQHSKQIQIDVHFDHKSVISIFFSILIDMNC